MIDISNVSTTGWEPAVHGMRNPMNSWKKSDSSFLVHPNGDIHIGNNDLNLMLNLSRSGTDHSKYRRMIVVYMDILAPLYWWKEFDTYKIGTVANSCSTMHKIQDKEFTFDDFSFEHMYDLKSDKIYGAMTFDTRPFVMSDMEWIYESIIKTLNKCRELYLETANTAYWWQMIQLLPSSYNQKRTVMLNYEVLANIYKSRRHHKLDEWKEFCKFIEQLPHSEIFTGITKNYD